MLWNSSVLRAELTILVNLTTKFVVVDRSEVDRDYAPSFGSIAPQTIKQTQHEYVVMYGSRRLLSLVRFV